MQSKEEKTYLMIKPDGVRKGLIGEIIRRLEQRDLKVVALQMVQPTHDQIDQHYPKDEAWIKRLGTKTMATYTKYGFDPVTEVGTADELEIGRRVRGWLVDYMTSAPVVKMVVQGVHAVDVVR
ncbi:MAG: nucleoside-diphosphate kinase, partial [Patescibacteria group bacterium]